MGNRPIKDFSCGNIKAAIFLNEREVNGNIVGFKTISLSRSFKKKDENVWRSEQINMRRNDLQKAILVLQKAQEDTLLDSKEESDDNE